MESTTQQENKKHFSKQIKRLIDNMEFPEVKPMPIVFFVKANDIKKKFELYKKEIIAELTELESLNDIQKPRKNRST